MFKKKPWSDGLFPDFDDSFESRFYCFGGDGGGSSSGGRNEPRKNKYDPSAQEPERGRPTRPTPPPPRPTPPPPPPEPDPRPKAVGIAELFPSAVVKPAAPPAKQRPTASQTAGLTEPRFGVESLLDVSGFTQPLSIGEYAVEFPDSEVQQTYQDATSLPPSSGRTIGSLAEKFGLPDTLNIGGYEIGFPEVGPGRLEPSINPQDKSIGLNYKMDISSSIPSVPPNPKTETDAEFDARMDRLYGEQYEQDRARELNEARMNQYLADQSDVGVYTPPMPPAPSFDERPLTTMLGERILPESMGGFADPLMGYGSNLRNLLDPSGNPYAGTTGAFVPTVGFENGGDVPVQEGVGGLFSPEEQARMAKIAAAEIQPDGSMPGVDTLRYATPEEVDVGAYNYQKDLEDKLLYHIKERDKVRPFEFTSITVDRKRFHQNQVEQVQKLIEDFRGQRGAAVANYRDYIAAGGRPLIVNTEEEPYFKSFPTDLINFRATKP